MSQFDGHLEVLSVSSTQKGEHSLSDLLGNGGILDSRSKHSPDGCVKLTIDQVGPLEGLSDPIYQKDMIFVLYCLHETLTYQLRTVYVHV